MNNMQAKAILEKEKLWESNDRVKTAFDIGIKALETVEKIKHILNEKDYNNADECDYGNYSTCENALMIKDIKEVLEVLS